MTWFKLRSTTCQSPLRKFARDDSGVVSVDWIVLTAALVGMAVTLYAILQPSVAPLPQTIENALNTVNRMTFEDN